MTADVTTPRSRRSLLTAAAGGAAAAAATTLARAAPVAAEGETITVGSEHTTATSRTFLKNSTTDSDVLVVTTNGSGRAIWGKSTDGTGVVAESVDGVGLVASGKTHGVRAESTNGAGVRGVSVDGFGVWGQSHNGDAVRGESTGGNALVGGSRDGIAVLAGSENGHALKTIQGRVQFGEVSGVAVIPAGSTSAEVWPGVTIDGSSFVLLTPRANIGSRGLWYTTNASANTFRIRISSARPRPTKVAWLLLG